MIMCVMKYSKKYNYIIEFIMYMFNEYPYFRKWHTQDFFVIQTDVTEFGCLVK